MAEIDEEIKHLKPVVIELLKEKIMNRNSDIWLIFNAWKKQGLLIEREELLIIKKEDMGQLIHPESLRRVRQEIQNTDGEYLPTDVAVLIRRQIKQSIIHDYYAGNKEVLSEYDRVAFGVK